MSEPLIAEARETFLAVIQGLNAGDADALKRHAHPAFTLFFFDGGLLDDGPAVAGDVWWDGLKGVFAAGFKTNLQVRHLDVNVLENTAVLTGYVVGTLTYPGANPIAGTWRFSITMIRTEGRWLEVHGHYSPLTI